MQQGPIIVVGSAGMLGRAMLAALHARSAAGQVIAWTRRDVDLSLPASVEEAMRLLHDLRPRALINCAAWTDVDGAEAREEDATRVNGTAVGELARACARASCVLVNFGTDYVFNGQGTRPYRVDDPLDPINAYGRSKAAGERALAGLDPRWWLHVRTSWLYAPWGKNFVRTIASAAKTRPVLKVVNDQRGRPTSAQQLASTTLALLDAGARGIHHATDAGECTWFELASEVVRRTGAAARVEPCTSAEFPRPAPRPAYSVLDLEQTLALVHDVPDWRKTLAGVVGRLEA